MEHYAYRTELTPDERADPFIAAAFAVASRAHANQPRHKLDPKITYITHPLMVMDILRRMGVRDSHLLAAALLHDVLEDHKNYRNTAEEDAAAEGTRKHNNRMLSDLRRELQAFVERGILTQEAATDGALQIFDLVKQVTKPVVYDENEKLPAQIDKISHACLECKILKIADQASSLICRLMARDDPKKFPPEKQMETRKKADNLVGYILRSAKTAADKRALKPWTDFFHQVETQTRRFDEGGGMVKRTMYRSLDFDDFFVPIKKQKSKPVYQPEHEVVLQYPIPPEMMGNVSSPLIRVDVNSTMQVVRFVIRRGAGKDDPVYAMRRRLVNEEIPETNRMAYQYTNPTAQKVEVDGIVQLISGGESVQGRLFLIQPPMGLQAFMGTAYRAGACTIQQDHTTQREVARTLQKPHAPLGMRDVWMTRVRGDHGNDTQAKGRVRP